MAPDKKPTPTEKPNISISGDVKDSAVFIGDNNTVNQTIIQKFFNIFKSDSETLEQRNRRILLNHVENAWIKGVLDASLHGAALLDLGIKQDPEAVTKYPWAIKKESTDETLPAGTSMLEIFDSIGMGRSLLIVGAPGSGKTTMLLELARGLIARAREDVTQPIPMVFNLASWTEKLSLADWLAQELNNLYSVPRKTAPDWVKGNKLLLLLDGLDEVRQESRAKCVEAINAFRKEHGLTSLAVCSRSQDYADLNAKLSFEGAIEVQPLTQEQITEFFNRFGDEMTGIKRALEKDSALREMAETPLFLSIMIMAYRDKRDVEILVSGDESARRKHLLDTYVERMFERSRSKSTGFKKQEVLPWVSYLASMMIEHNKSPYILEGMQSNWLNNKKQITLYESLHRLFFGVIFGILFGFIFGPLQGIVFGIALWIISWKILKLTKAEIRTVDALSWSWQSSIKSVLPWVGMGVYFWSIFGFRSIGLAISVMVGLAVFFRDGIQIKQLDQTKHPRQRLFYTTRNFLIILLFFEVISGLIGMTILGTIFGSKIGLIMGLAFGLSNGLMYGGHTLIKYYILRILLSHYNLLPWRLVPFLDHCVDLIFLRRVGGGYIFVHRLLMEHFAEMYVESPTSKGN
jgi:hypothetical protein